MPCLSNDNPLGKSSCKTWKDHAIIESMTLGHNVEVKGVFNNFQTRRDDKERSAKYVYRIRKTCVGPTF